VFEICSTLLLISFSPANVGSFTLKDFCSNPSCEPTDSYFVSKGLCSSIVLLLLSRKWCKLPQSSHVADILETRFHTQFPHDWASYHLICYRCCIPLFLNMAVEFTSAFTSALTLSYWSDN
jgi:hypothetical protein